MVDLSSLISKLEGLSGPDREVDGLLWSEMDGRDVRTDGMKTFAKSRRAPFDECVLFIKGEHGLVIDFYHEPPLPRYTASLDAAVALVEKMRPGQLWHIMTAALRTWSIADGKPEDLPRFVVLALLRSLSQEGGDG